MNLPDDFTFSQSSLQDYHDCARRFQLRYLQRVRYPAPQTEPMLEQEHQMKQGAELHHLIHQHQLGIPADLLTERAHDPQVLAWWEAYLQHGLADLPTKRYPEITLSAPLGDYRLIAKYDLLAIDAGQKAVIVDWKTSRKKTRRQWLAKRLQTIVYRYVLATSGTYLNAGQAIAPEQIEMRYWFTADPTTAESFPYSSQQYQADEEELLGMVDHINLRIQFPLTMDESKCRFCSYRSLCERGVVAGDLNEWLIDFDDVNVEDVDIDMDQIGEIAF